MEKIVKVILVFALIGFIYCQRQNEIEMEDIEKKLKEEIPELQGFNASDLPIDKAEEAIRAKCDKNGGKDAFDKLKERQQELQSCFENLINVTSVQEELDKAAETGSMDEVFAKYCNKYPEFEKCLNNLRTAIVPCLEQQEIPTMNKAFNITKDIVDFSCVDSGDRLAMFVAEGGIECLSSKKEELELCVNKTIGDELRNISDQMAQQESFEPFPIPLFLLEDKHIKKFNTLHNCVRDTLETCDESTPANVIDSMFKYVKKIVFSPEVIKKAAAEEHNSAVIPTGTVVSLLVTLVLSKLL